MSAAGTIRGRLLLLAFLAGADTALAACVTEHADLSFDRGTYSYKFSALIDAEVAAVRTVVTDHARMHRLNDNIAESRVLQRHEPDALTRFLRLERCILGYCFNMRFTETVREQPALITTTIIPAASSFVDGVTRWRLSDAGSKKTLLTLAATQTPDFWIPPVIGPYVLKRVFIAEVEETCGRIDALARGNNN